VIILLLSLPPKYRYKSDGYWTALATPGPDSPGDAESFLWIVLSELAIASEGIWVWDAIESSYILHRSYLCMMLGDMLGSAKFSGMAGHSAVYGDRFGLVKGACSGLQKGAKAQY
ncbi:hypothetical protein L208DRAFT_1115654, partial [Tricholoma matsutake]